MTGPLLPPGIPPDPDLAKSSRAETVLRIIGILVGLIFVVGLFYLAYLR